MFAERTLTNPCCLNLNFAIARWLTQQIYLLLLLLRSLQKSSGALFSNWGKNVYFCLFSFSPAVGSAKQPSYCTFLFAFLFHFTTHGIIVQRRKQRGRLLPQSSKLNKRKVVYRHLARWLRGQPGCLKRYSGFIILRKFLPNTLYFLTLFYCSSISILSRLGFKNERSQPCEHASKIFYTIVMELNKQMMLKWNKVENIIFKVSLGNARNADDRISRVVSLWICSLYDQYNQAIGATNL